MTAGPIHDSKATIGILLSEPTTQRLMEGIAAHLELRPVILTNEDLLTPDTLTGMELLFVDELSVPRLRHMLLAREEHQEGINPSLVAVITAAGGMETSGAREQAFDGVVLLPQSPAAVLAQVSVLLYAHRAYAKRYQSALEELHLNRRIFRSVTSGISIANATLPDMPLVYVNPAFEIMTGYSLEEAQGKNCRFLQGKERDQPGLTLVREALSARRETVALLKNFRKSGEPFWNELSLSPIRSRDGDITHIVGIQNDVTARVEFEQALRQSEKLAAVGRLAASIAHEINNPLESLINLLFLARTESQEAQKDAYLELAEKELVRVSLITSQSLRFYKQSTRPQAVRPVDLITAVLDVHAAQLAMNGIKLERRDRMCESIVCMESEIRQVLNNLVTNARDAMRGMIGRLHVRTREATDWRSDVKGVVITVADTGIGMNAATLHRLYDAFYTTKGNLGTGLGMWISSEIVARHGGRLLVRSHQDPGSHGTVFQLFLPYQAAVQG